MRLDRVLQGIGAITVLIVLISAAWVPVSAVITMNSTGGVDILKVLTISPSSGSTVNMTGNLEIEKDASRLILKSTTASSAGIEFHNSTGQVASMIHREDASEFRFTDEGGNPKFSINSSTGDITQMGKIKQPLVMETDSTPTFRVNSSGGSARLTLQNATHSWMLANDVGNTGDLLIAYGPHGAEATKLRINEDGDITKMGKFTQNVEIEKTAPILILDSVSNGNPHIAFEAEGIRYALLEYDRANDDVMVTDSGVTQTLRIDVSTGDITQAGRIEVGDGSNEAQGTLKSNSTGLYVYTGTEWSQIKAY